MADDEAATAVADDDAQKGMSLNEARAAIDLPPAKVEETVTMTKAEAEALRRRVAESEKAQRKYEADRKKADEERQAEQGKWQELAQTREQELNQTREQAARVERDARVARIAARLKFLDPADVTGRVNAEEGADDALAEAALERIAQRSPHLVAKEAPATPEIGQVLTPAVGPGSSDTGRPQPPPGKAPLRSLDEANLLPQAEVVARMDEVEWLERQEQGRK